MFLFALPLLFALIGAGLSFLKERPYVGQISFYTGQVENESLLKPELIKEKYEVEDGSFDVSVADKTITFISIANDKDQVEKTLERVTDQYEKDLVTQSEKNLALKKEYLNSLKNRHSSLLESLKTYNENIENKDTDPELAKQYLESIVEAEEKIFQYEEGINLEENSILAYDEPRELKMVINREKSYITSNIILGIVLGMFMALGLITLWKYVSDARGSAIR